MKWCPFPKAAKLICISSSTTDVVLNLFGTLSLQGLGLGTTSLGLLSNLSFHDALGLFLVNGLNQHTLVLEYISLALHVDGVVEVLVDLLGITVLLQQATEHTKATHPDDGLGHASILATNTPSSTSVTTLALSRQVLPDAEPGVNLLWLLDHQTILSELANIQAGIRHADLVDFIGVQPDLALSALQNRCRQSLLELEGDHFETLAHSPH